MNLSKRDPAPAVHWVPTLAMVLLFGLSFVPLTDEIGPWLPWGVSLGCMFLAPFFFGVFIWASGLHIAAGRLCRRLDALSVPYWPAGVSVIMFGLSFVLAGVIYGHLPGQMDSYAYYIQAKIFASGRWYAPSQAVPEFFNTQWFVNDGRYYSQYPPGHPMALAVAVALGVPWLFGPLMAVAGILLIYALGREIGNERIARIATCLALVSPVVMFMSAEYMSHSTAWVCANAFALCYIRAHRRGSVGYALAAGTLLGFLFVVRPQVSAALAVPFGLYWLWPSAQPRQGFWRCGFAMATMVLAGLAFFLYYDWQTTGDAWITPYEKYQTYDHFKKAIAEPLLYNLHRVILQTAFLHIRLLGWPFSSLQFVLLLFAARLQKRYAALLMWGCLSVVASLYFIPYTGGIYKPRYLFEVTGFLFVLTAMAIDRAVLWLKVRFLRDWPVCVVRMSVYAYVIILTVCATPVLVRMYEDLMAKDWPDRSYPEVYKMLEQRVNKPGLVFVRDNYYMASLFNPPDDNAPIIAAHDLGERNKELMRQYPYRFVYTYDGNELRLVRSPLAQ